MTVAIVLKNSLRGEETLVRQHQFPNHRSYLHTDRGLTGIAAQADEINSDQPPMLDIARIRELEDKRVYHNPTQAALRRLHQIVHQGLITEVGCFVFLLLWPLTARSPGQMTRVTPSRTSSPQMGFRQCRRTSIALPVGTTCLPSSCHGVCVVLVVVILRALVCYQTRPVHASGSSRLRCLTVTLLHYAVSCYASL